MNEPKQQHYVPRMLLKNFVDDKTGRLHFFSKKCPEKGVMQALPEKLFRQQHLYTRRGETGAKDFSVEYGLAELEALSTPVIDGIVQLARAWKSPKPGIAHRILRDELTLDDRMVLSWFIASQQTRVPDFQDSVVSDAEFEKIAHRKMEDLEAKGQAPSSAERDKLLSVPELKRMRKNLMARFAVPNEPFATMLISKRVHAIRITKTNKSFVIGSRPVVRPGRTHIEDATAQSWLPVAHDVAVLLCAENGGPARMEIIRWLNEALFKQSTFVAGRSNKLLASLSGCRCRSVR